MLRCVSMTIERSGRVHWAVRGNWHCGPETAVYDGRVVVEWKLVALCQPVLDAHGFLFDQAPLQAWMEDQAIKPTGLSCERLVQRTCRRFMAHVHAVAPVCKLHSLDLRFSPHPHNAAVTAAFKEASL